MPQNVSHQRLDAFQIQVHATHRCSVLLNCFKCFVHLTKSKLSAASVWLGTPKLFTPYVKCKLMRFEKELKYSLSTLPFEIDVIKAVSGFYALVFQDSVASSAH